MYPVKRNTPIVRWGLILFCLICDSAMAHDYHASVATVARNREANTLEVIVRVFSNDLERALAAENNKPGFRLQESDEPLVAALLAKHFRVRADDRRALPHTWIGMEWTVKEVWIYLEIVLPPATGMLSLENTLLLEQFADQVNTVNLSGKERHTLVFRKGTQILHLPPHW